MPEEGELVGNISGGCLENDVADVAKIVMREGVARIVSFDLTADDDAVWGWGLGCNGAFELFVEPADKAAEVAGALRMALEEERPISMVTVLDSDVPGVEQGNPHPREAGRRRRTVARDESSIGSPARPPSSSGRGAQRGPRTTGCARARRARSSRCSSRRCVC